MATPSAAARGCYVVLITCPSHTVARTLARWMIAGHHAACVNILGPAESLYWWKGRVERAQEYLLIVKTTRRNLPTLERGLIKRHPYTVPECIALPIAAGLRPYLAWLHASCHQSRS